MGRLLIPILFVFSIILFRASHQAVTLDEADGFNNFANENMFYPSSGNHVLYSLLARASTHFFGVSQFTFRIPSTMGAVIYLLAVAAIMARIARHRLTLPLLEFAVLTFN